MNNLKTVIEARIEAILNAEKITRVELAALSRELLMYVPDTNDVDMVNRLINVLTPMNRKTAILFFSDFLPWEQEKNGDTFSRFGKKMQGDKKVQKRMDKIKVFLSVEENNIWTWAESNLEVELKPIDFVGNIEKAVKAALEGNKKREQPGISRLEVLNAVFSSGLTINDFLAFSEILEARRLEAEKFLAAGKPAEEPVNA